MLKSPEHGWKMLVNGGGLVTLSLHFFGEHLVIVPDQDTDGRHVLCCEPWSSYPARQENWQVVPKRRNEELQDILPLVGASSVAHEYSVHVWKKYTLLRGKRRQLIDDTSIHKDIL